MREGRRLSPSHNRFRMSTKALSRIVETHCCVIKARSTRGARVAATSTLCVRGVNRLFGVIARKAYLRYNPSLRRARSRDYFIREENTGSYIKVNCCPWSPTSWRGGDTFSVMRPRRARARLNGRLARNGVESETPF